MLDTVNTLKDLIAIASVNPMGHEVSGPEYYEYRMTDYLQQVFQSLGVRWERQQVAPKRDNIIARIDGNTSPEEGGEVIMFEVHQDTVPVEGMIIDPWTPEIRDGKIFGRGSCDIKGGMAAMINAFSRLAEERPAGMPTLLLACTVNEEHGFTGATAMTQAWQRQGDSLLNIRPDAIIVAEPTMLDVVVAHKGVVRWLCKTIGRAVHSSVPHLGDNAIYKMSHLLQALEKYQQEVLPNCEKHHLCGGPTLSVGTISGGLSVNTVPAECVIEIDHRIAPDADPQQAFSQVVDYVNQAMPNLRDSIEPITPYMIAPGLSDANNANLADSLLTVIVKTIGQGNKIGVNYGTDATAFSAAKIPTVIFGPGSINQAHTADEWVSLEQLRLASEAYFQFGRVGLNG